MTTTQDRSAVPSGPDSSPPDEAPPGHWFGTIANYLGSAVGIITAVRLDLPYALLVPGLTLITALWGLRSWRVRDEQWRRQHSQRHTAAVLALAVSTASIAGLLAYAAGAGDQRGESRRETSVLSQQVGDLRTERDGLVSENAAFRRDKAQLQKEQQELADEVERLRGIEGGSGAAVVGPPTLSPSPGPSAGSSPTAEPVAGSAPYRLDLTRRAFYDFDARRAMPEATADFEVQYNYGALYFGESRDTWHGVRVVFIPTSNASAAGCDSGTKLQVNVAQLSELEQDESICVSTSGGRWAVMKLLPSDTLSDSASFDVRIF